MGAKEYGALCKRRAEDREISQNLLASRLMRVFALEDDEERTFDSSAVRTIYDGRRKIDAKLFRHLNSLLRINRDEAEHALGIWPSEMTLEEYRRFRRELTLVPERAKAPMCEPGRFGKDSAHPWPRPLRKPAERRQRRRRHERRHLAPLPLPEREIAA